MPKDFANRPKSKQKSRSNGPRPRAKPAQRKRKKAAAKTLFHGASFSAGIVLGIVLAVLGAYAPQLFEDELKQISERREQASPVLRFEFDKLLRDSEVVTDPGIYSIPKDNAGVKTEYLLQAASFRNQDDAEGLRATLLLLGLPTNSYRVQLESGSWFRVLVGPFSTQLQAQRAMTRLRKENISALLIKRPV